MSWQLYILVVLSVLNIFFIIEKYKNKKEISLNLVIILKMLYLYFLYQNISCKINGKCYLSAWYSLLYLVFINIMLLLDYFKLVKSLDNFNKLINKIKNAVQNYVS